MTDKLTMLECIKSKISEMNNLVELYEEKSTFNFYVNHAGAVYYHNQEQIWRDIYEVIDNVKI